MCLSKSLNVRRHRRDCQSKWQTVSVPSPFLPPSLIVVCQNWNSSAQNLFLLLISLARGVKRRPFRPVWGVIVLRLCPQTRTPFFLSLRVSNTAQSDAGGASPPPPWPVLKIRSGPRARSQQLASPWMLLQRDEGPIAEATVPARPVWNSEVILFFLLLLPHVTYWPWQLWQQH